MERLLAKTEISAPLDEAVYAMVLNRISDPLSKRAVNEWVNEIYRPSFDELQLHHFYRALDFLIENKELVESELFEQTRNLFNLELGIPPPLTSRATGRQAWRNKDIPRIAAPTGCK